MLRHLTHHHWKCTQTSSQGMILHGALGDIHKLRKTFFHVYGPLPLHARERKISFKN